MLTTGSRFLNIPEILVKVRVGREMNKRRGDINIFFAWCKNQKHLLDNKKTNIPCYILSCIGCLGFIMVPSRLKGVLYKNILRNKM